MRDASQAPRNSRELAVRNQFFTPRYVVEFLTDNTLGRIWYEMRKGETGLTDECQYLVRRPNELFLENGEEPPEPPEGEDPKDLTQEELLNQPVHIPHRSLKDPREIRMLDPACGSMHFGLYAFDLYLKIYEEFWDLLAANPDVAIEPTEFPSLLQAYESREAFLRDVPRLIIEHNIHGIDIDPRAVQIAGLSLWLRAQRAWKSQGIAAGDRPQVTRSNIVCAEPMPGDQQQLAAFCKELHPAIAQMVTAIFEEMKLAGEAGSLLKIEQEIKTLVAAAHKQWRTTPRETQMQLFGEADVVKEQQLEFDLSGITDQQFFEQAEETIYEALRKYASETSEGGFRRKLFAGDAEKGFAFIEAMRKRFDVVLMNPPFGAFPKTADKLLNQSYAKCRGDLYPCFITRASEISELRGAITNRSGFTLKGLADWRLESFVEENRLALLADLGGGVLDALVETAAYVTDNEESQSIAFNLLAVREDVKGEVLYKATQFSRECLIGDRYIFEAKRFSALPSSPIAYTATPGLLRVFSEHRRFEDDEFIFRSTSPNYDDFRFLALSWEVPAEHFGRNKRWSYLAKGGEYQPFIGDIHLVADWDDDRTSFRGFTGSEHRPLERPACADLFFSPGLTWSGRTASRFSPRILPDNTIFSSKGPFAGGVSRNNLLLNLGILMSAPCQLYLEVFVQAGDATSSGSAARDYQVGSLRNLPYPNLSNASKDAIVQGVKRIAAELKRPLEIDETSAYFELPLHEWKKLATIEEIDKQFAVEYVDSAFKILKESRRIDDLVAEGYKIEPRDVESIQAVFGRHPLAYNESSDFPDEHFAKLFSDGVNDVINKAIAEGKTGRFIAVKSYYADRHLEVVSHYTEVSADSLRDLFLNNAVVGSNSSRIARLIVSYAMGVLFGRWNPNFVKQSDNDPDFFEPLAYASPPTLRNGNEDDSELILGDVVAQDTVNNDFSVAIRRFLELLWSDNTDSIESSLCKNLNVKSIKQYFGSPSNFFSDHLSLYTKSRRSAPIYWPISTESGSYTLWFYYHRLTDQTLYKAVNDFVDPKLKETLRQLADLRAIKDRTSSQEKELAQLTELESELEQFKADLLGIAAFWKPNLNDGVQITAAPLWKFFRLTKWRNKLKKTWSELESGKYDWAHLALSIWPDRVVREKCTTDRSIAIAHDMEDLLWVEDDESGKWRRVMEPSEECTEQVRRHTETRFAKALQQLTQKSESDMESEAKALMTALATGTLEEDPLALTLWPERVAKACWTDPKLAAKHSLKLPRSQAQSKKRTFVKRQIDSGAKEITESLTKACQAHDGTFKDFWKCAVDGEFDDKDFARWLWPERVAKKCQTDLDIARAHRLEKYFWTHHPSGIHRQRVAIETELQNEIERVKTS